jgi:hypothetical protein
LRNNSLIISKALIRIRIIALQGVADIEFIGIALLNPLRQYVCKLKLILYNTG